MVATPCNSKASARKRAVSPSPHPSDESPKRQKRREKKVRFSPCRNEEHGFPIYEERMPREEKSTVRSSLWYTRSEYDNFLYDRVQTIRVFRTVGGEISMLEPNYCLRGLEPYKSPLLNTEMYSHRTAYRQTVLKEQSRQRRALEVNPQRIAQQVSHMSNWALSRAHKLAVLDAKDANEYYTSFEKKTHCTRIEGAECATATWISHQMAMSLRGISVTANTPYSPIFTSKKNPPVNVTQLKKWNALLVKQFVTLQKGKNTPLADSKLIEHANTKDCVEPKMSLKSLMANTRRRISATSTALPPIPDLGVS